MMYRKKEALQQLLKFEENSRYSILNDNYELPVFIDKEGNNYCQAGTKREFYRCLMETKINYFKDPQFINGVCENFAYLKAYDKSEKKEFYKGCKVIINKKLQTLEQEL